MLTAGCGYMVWLKLKSDPALGDVQAWGGDLGFVLLLGFVALSGLLLYALGQTVVMPSLLALHLGSVLAFFLLTPFSKMVHSFFRLAALIRNADVEK